MAIEKPINEIFKTAQGIKYGAKFNKVDLHFHTPASEDARGSNRYGFNPYKKKYPARKNNPNYREKVDKIRKDILIAASKLAEDIVGRFIEEDLSLVAITDHNGIGTIWNDDESKKNFMDLAAPTWYELIDDAAQKVNNVAGKTMLTILPGTEISTTGIHILAIFPPQVPRRKVHFMICDLLNEIGFDIDEWGKNPEVGTASPFDAISLIVNKGGIPILAHIDGRDQGILGLHEIKSGAMENVLCHKQLSAVEIIKPSRFSKKDIKLKKPLKNWIDTLRWKEELSSLAYFQGSDAHDLTNIAKRYSYIKVTEPSFSGFSTAIKMPSSRVRCSGLYKPEMEGFYVHSVLIKNSYFGEKIIRFNRHGNCITGKKGSGKSGIFKLMQAAANPEFTNGEGDVVLFVEKMKAGNSRYYAFSRKEQQDSIKLYEIINEAALAEEIDIDQGRNLGITPKFYNSDKIELLISSRDELNKFLVRHFGKATETNKGRFNDRFSIPGFLTEDEDNEPLLAVDINNSSYKLSINIQWNYSKAKMKEFFTLNESLRRTAITCMIIIASDFGPTIIDAPEEHFDNEDIAQILVPIIKRYKDFQQLILFTNNPLLAVNTDPDNYIVLERQGEKLKKLTPGFAIDDEQKKPLLLNIMEGSQRSFNRRADRYKSNE